MVHAVKIKADGMQGRLANQRKQHPKRVFSFLWGYFGFRHGQEGFRQGIIDFSRHLKTIIVEWFNIDRSV
jgi:hypothetical protein